MKFSFNMTLKYIAWPVIFIAAFLFFGSVLIVNGVHFGKKHLWEDGLSIYEIERIGLVKPIMCELNGSLCNELKNEEIGYRSIRYPKFFDLFRSYYFVGAMVLPKQGIIQLSRYLFEDPAMLAVVLYHEWLHVTESDFEQYTTVEYAFARCVDHNNVKIKTLDFAKMLDLNPDIKLIPGYAKKPTYYANLNGNILDDCENYL